MSKTIAAVATPPGRGGVGIVRVSGPDAETTLRALVSDWPTDHPSHKLRLCDVAAPDGAPIDRALCVVYRAPASFTGEEVVEVQCHGGPVVLRKALDACIAAGCRVARPGEFTERAFLNGKLDLTQAEAVADLVNATTETAHALALEHLDGSLGAAIRAGLQKLTEAMVLVEAAIDFSHEEHVYQIQREEIRGRLVPLLGELRALRDRFDSGRRRREGVRVVVLGPPNAGKSTLFNLLVEDERAIVTDIAGTTRDWLEEELVLDGVRVRLVDTAGLRRASDAVETIGIERSRTLGARADVALFVLDRTQELDPEARTELAAQAERGRPLLVCRNKADIDGDSLLPDELSGEVFDTSFATGDGVRELVARLTDLAHELTAAEGVLISRARHLEAVVTAIDALERTLEGLDAEAEHELLALDLRDALDALGTIVGHVSTDDILAKIFGEFCVGK